MTLVSRILLLEPNVKRHIYIDVVVVTNYVIFANYTVMFPYMQCALDASKQLTL